MENIFIISYRYFANRRRLLFTGFGLLVMALTWFASRVHFEEDISKVIPKDRKTEKLNQLFQNSKFIDKLVVTVSLKDTMAAEQPDSLVAYADLFAEKIQQQLSRYVSKLDYRVDDGLAMDLFTSISDHLPIYLEEKDYRSIDSLIRPAVVRKTLEQDFRTLTSPAGMALKSMISNDPVGISMIAFRKLQQVQFDENFELYDSYVVTKNHKNLMMFITPVFPPNNTGENARLLAGLDRVIDSLQLSGFKNITTTYFGATAVSAGNAMQLRKDSIYTQGLTVVLLLLFLGWYFRKNRAPFIIMVPVIFGALFSLAMIYFVKGSISVIALGTGSVVLGIAVSYSIHVFNHYRHTQNMQQVIRDLTLPLTIGGFTTIGGFLCLEFVQSDMLKDLGLFAAFSLVGASLCSLIFLPHFIVSPKSTPAIAARNQSWIDTLASYRPEYNKWLIVGILALTVVFAYTSRFVGFESDLMRMNYMSPALKNAENTLNRVNAYSLQSVYLVSEGKTLDDALVNNEKLAVTVEKLRKQGIVKKSSGVSALIISDSLQQIRIQRWNAYWTKERKTGLLSVLEREGRPLKFKAAAFDPFRALLQTHFRPLPAGSTDALRKNLLDDFITEKPGVTTVVTLLKTSPQYKQVIYDTFENDPNTTVIDRQYLTGRFVGIINADFTRIALMSSILVFTVLLLTYGRIELTLVSFIPMFITWIWILGIMGLTGIQFNIINIIISALIFGLGDDYSLFIMDGLLKEYKTGQKTLSSYKSSIFLSAITTVAGLGVLIFAKHPALRSIAGLAIIGMLCVVIISQIMIPFFFTLLIKQRAASKRFPWTMAGLLKSLFAFSYFIIGSILLTIIGFIFRALRFNSAKGKLAYHRVLSSFCRSMMYNMGNVKKVVVNPSKETFAKPAVVIANHQSFLDILAMVMLHPKLILFTNHWVWNSPVFGAVVRMADYFPVMQGVEGNLDVLAERVNQGYSVVIFPEGTRSADGQVKRFHKGAFFLAESLGIDILPIVIHGTGYTMSKGDFLLKDGRVTLKILPRISQANFRFGTGYALRTKQIGHYFRDEYEKLSHEIEQPVYFRQQLIANYLYKGPVLEWYMRIKIRLEGHYQLFHELVPRQGTMLDLGCGYGFMAYMLHFAARGRQVTAIDYDEEKIATANHCFSKAEGIRFLHHDVTRFNFDRYDAVIMADMLHYLEPGQQEAVIIAAIKSLNPGGVLIIRDGNSELAKKHRGTRLTEFFSTKVLGFNKTTDRGLSFLSGEFIRRLAHEHQVGCMELDETKFTSNVIYVIRDLRPVRQVPVDGEPYDNL